MISWDYQTFLKNTLSINIFLILNFTIRGPAWIFASLQENYFKKKKLWKQIEQTLFW